MTSTTGRPVITSDHVAQADLIAMAADRAASYGVRETGTLSAADIAARESIDYSKPRTWLGDPALVKITRIRMVGFADYDFPFSEISYVYGELRDGTPVLVDLGIYQVTKARWKSQIIQAFKDAKRFGKSMGVDVNSSAVISRV